MRVPNHVAPAGTAINLRDIGRAMALELAPTTTMAQLDELIAQHIGGGTIHYFNSGRAALTVVARALARMEKPRSRLEVILPGYTCYSVAASMLRAGLSIRVCDIDLSTLDFDPELLTNQKTSAACAIVTANLYGIPNDLRQIKRFAEERSLFLVDDAAQSLGAEIGGFSAGSAGDVGLFSFDKGKVVTSMQGGCIAVRNAELSKYISHEVALLPPPKTISTVTDIVKFIAYGLLLPPNRYWITEHLPSLGLGLTRFEDDFPITRYSPHLAALLIPLLNRLDQLRIQRATNAALIQEALERTCFKPISPHPQSTPAWVRFPVIAPCEALRDEAVETLRHAGVGASRSYPLCLRDVPELQSALRSSDDTPSARSVARRLFTLPTHAYVAPQHVELMSELLSRISDGAA